MGYRQRGKQAIWGTLLSSELSSIYRFLSHQKAFFMLIELKDRPCVQHSKCVHLDVHVCVRASSNNHLECVHPSSIFYSQSLHWQSFPQWERYTPKHIQTSMPDSTVKLIYLSMASPVCLSSNPFHHSVILLSVCLHSSVIIRQKSVTHTSSLELTRLYTSLRSKPRQRHTPTKLCKNSPQLHHFFFCCNFLD